ncbi:MAG: tRNA (adenosine(37)-N6)-threonylcarbamoyltransferase complex transferase subunit TsaD, partial [Eubacteriaceae bacterium]|nr:tRNA (adenosine(37)-N6)-threonylcarbamoyltransferase complex transferase subunit TsaD [Eubacteriaceae bacterium]
MKILAIESSCDETSIAIVEDGRNVIVNKIYSQIDIHKKYGGVVPEIASRNHVIKLPYVLESAL